MHSTYHVISCLKDAVSSPGPQNLFSVSSLQLWLLVKVLKHCVTDSYLYAWLASHCFLSQGGSRLLQRGQMKLWFQCVHGI